MRKAIAIIGYTLIAVAVLGLALEVGLAAKNGQAFYGTNYKGLALGTYSTLIVLLIAAAIGVTKLVQVLLARRRSGNTRRDAK